DGTHADQVWNAAGDLSQITLPGGLVLQYTYDYAHRMTVMKRSGDPQPLESRSYDPIGRLASVTDSRGRTTRSTYTGDGLPLTTERVRADGSALGAEPRTP